MATKKTEIVQEEPAVKDPQADWETVFLFKDNNEYRFDLPVIVNGKAYLVKRGEPVRVPPEVAEVIRHAEMQSAAAVRTIETFKKPIVVDNE